MDLATLCRRIRMPEEVTAILISMEKQIAFPCLDPLRIPGQWEDGLQEVKAALREDPDGFKMLLCMLRCAVSCWEDYAQLGISEEIYFDTMACFSRFVGEHKTSFGRYGFDRDFWTVRQVSAVLFRIGELEYELLEEKGQKVVSLHIPSDCRLELPRLRKSWEEAKNLISEKFPDFADVPYVCTSWLLSPDLPKMLPENSRILAFQQAFTLKETYPDPEFKEWVYKRTDIADTDLPEDTTLQRRLKAFLLAGNTFHSGFGILHRDPFVQTPT